MKKIVSVILAITMALSMSMAVYAADHINPATGGLCNSTYYYPVHTGHNSAWKAPHVLPSGMTCWVEYVNLQHKKRCSSCNGLLSDAPYNKTCCEYHDICSDIVNNCYQ